MSIFNSFNFLPNDYKFWFAVVAGIIFAILLLYSLYKGSYYKKQKKRMMTIINKEGDIVEDILNGKLKNTNIIHDRYKQIWIKQKTELKE